MQKAGSNSVEQLNDNSLSSYPPTILSSKLAPTQPPSQGRSNAAFTLAEVFSPHSAGKRKIAFTLAEVLITLGIIGVVAALTLPTLIQHHRKSVVETRLAKFYSTINQAIQRAEVDYGDKKYWDALAGGFELDENDNRDLSKPKALPWFDKYLRPYLNVARVEVLPHREGRIAVYFPDGSLLLLASTWLYYPEAKNCKLVSNDESSLLQNDRSTGGMSFFTFVFYPDRDKGVEPYMYWRDEVYLKTNQSQGCLKDNINSLSERALCAALIKKNGWKIPDDYPLKF